MSTEVVKIHQEVREAMSNPETLAELIGTLGVLNEEEKDLLGLTVGMITEKRWHQDRDDQWSGHDLAENMLGALKTRRVMQERYAAGYYHHDTYPQGNQI